MVKQREKKPVRSLHNTAFLTKGLSAACDERKLVTPKISQQTTNLQKINMVMLVHQPLYCSLLARHADMFHG